MTRTELVQQAQRPVLQPLGNRVLIRDILTDETLPGGKVVLLDDTRLNLTSQQAEVIVAGKDCDQRLVEGAWIFHKPLCRSEGPRDGEYWIKEDDVVAVIE